MVDTRFRWSTGGYFEALFNLYETCMRDRLRTTSLPRPQSQVRVGVCMNACMHAHVGVCQCESGCIDMTA